MTLREELDARLAEFDRRSAQATRRADAVLSSWAAERVAPSNTLSRLRAFFRRGYCESA